MSVEFASGPFSASGGGWPARLTEFVLDREVNLTVGVQIDENDGEFLVYLIKHHDDGTVQPWVGTGPIDSSGVSIAVRFDAVEAGYWEIHVIPLGSTTVAGSFTASWENLAFDEGSPVDVPGEPRAVELTEFDEDADVEIVEWEVVDSDDHSAS